MTYKEYYTVLFYDHFVNFYYDFNETSSYFLFEETAK